MKLLTIVGARPQFIKACMLSKALKKHSHIEEIIVHTGQHYDYNMSDVFFKQLNIPQADYNLGVGSGTHGEQTAKMLIELEKLMQNIKPDIVIVYGDTNSTVAGSLAATKLHIPIAHIESGLRSFNKKMPEEVNRIIADHTADYLFCPTETAVKNLKKEGINKGIYQTGDIMYDTLAHFKPFAIRHSSILNDLELRKENYYLATIHRAENTDNPLRLNSILQALRTLNEPVVLPLHPRTKNKIEEFNLSHLLSSPNIKLIYPVNYFDMLMLTANASAVLTDSGGLQKEAYMLQTLCITLRDETEWIETVNAGWNHIAGAKMKDIVRKTESLERPRNYPLLYGEGTADKITEILLTAHQKN